MDRATRELLQEIQKEANPLTMVDGYIYEDYPLDIPNPSDVDLEWLDEGDPPTEEVQEVIHAIRHWTLASK